MAEWIVRAYIMTLEYNQKVLPRFVVAQRYHFRELCYADWAIKEVLSRFDRPYDINPSVIVENFYRQLEEWGRKSLQKDEPTIASMFLTAGEVIRNLSDYLALHGAY